MTPTDLIKYPLEHFSPNPVQLFCNLWDRIEAKINTTIGIAYLSTRTLMKVR